MRMTGAVSLRQRAGARRGNCTPAGRLSVSSPQRMAGKSISWVAWIRLATRQHGRVEAQPEAPPIACRHSASSALVSPHRTAVVPRDGQHSTLRLLGAACSAARCSHPIGSSSHADGVSGSHKPPAMGHYCPTKKKRPGAVSPSRSRKCLSLLAESWSGRVDSNHRPLGPEPALHNLRMTPMPVLLAFLAAAPADRKSVV